MLIKPIFYLLLGIILFGHFQFSFGELANLVHLADVLNRFWMINTYVYSAYMLCECFLSMHASCLNTKPLDGVVLWYTIYLCVSF